jgi:DNA-binding NtrC family response regulator
MTRRILVVDDDHTMVRTLCDLFRLKGWQPLGVHSGEEAVAAESTDRYDVVLIDLKMPGMDGLEAFKMMKAHSPDVKVVLMTAQGGQQVVEDAQQSGALRVLAKPIDLNALFAFLDAQLIH